MITKENIEGWGGWVLGILGSAGVIWNRLGIRRLAIKTDGLLEYRSRADRAEGNIEGRDSAMDRADKKDNHE